MRTRIRLLAMSIILLGLLANCGERAASIPAGAQKVHVAVTESGIRLDPETVPAGDVYVVLDTAGSSVGFLQGQDGPLSDETLARVTQTGDLEGTSIQSFDQVGCSAEQRAEDLGQLGPCGNVSKVVLRPGRYAFFTGDLPASPPQSLVVLEALP
jgi:hypothetical protein